MNYIIHEKDCKFTSWNDDGHIWNEPLTCSCGALQLWKSTEHNKDSALSCGHPITKLVRPLLGPPYCESCLKHSMRNLAMPSAMDEGLAQKGVCMFNTLDHHNTTKKVSFRFDQLGRLCLRLIETMPDGKKLFYYLKEDGAWNQYDPASNSAEPLNNTRFPELAFGDPVDAIDP